jgi:hypothetical protein
MQRRRAAVAVSLVISACAGVSPATATAQERATCSAVYAVGDVASSLLSGERPPADDGVVRKLVVQSQEVQAGASMAANDELERDGARLARAAEALERPAAAGERPSQNLLVAFRSLLESCRSLGVHEPTVVAPEGPVLQASDLTGAWDSSSPRSGADSYARHAAAFRRCVGHGLTLPWGPMTHSDDFVQAGGARQIRSAAMYVGASDADALVALMKDDDAPRCMEATFRRSSAEDGNDRYDLLSVSTAPLPQAGAVVGLRTTMRVDVAGRTVTVFVDEVVLSAGGWFGRLQLLGAYEPLPGGNELVHAFTSRLNAASRSSQREPHP